MLSKIQYLVEGHFQRAAGAFNKTGFTPNSVTTAGFFLTLLASLFYSTGLWSSWLIIGATLALLFGAYLDAIDGAMARRYHQTSKIGGILDSILDRVGEIALFAGLYIGGLVTGWLILWSLSGSLLVSYVRARVDVEGVKLKGVGVAERPERLLILLVATVSYSFNTLALEVGVGLVALLSTTTVVERLYKTRMVLSSPEKV
ncbi:MAG TPA: CDP-alcohol phosphatidyltransferase family protein [Candidatus Bathyarchaeia archaeon]|jgi:archaetidylinositol phosphate synthase|nr:CDP-alcohol phosphatidyltransferase family protein [Candidatus Bathyarchaeia archaeon]